MATFSDFCHRIEGTSLNKYGNEILLHGGGEQGQK
jgi:hypothetical protein